MQPIATVDTDPRLSGTMHRCCVHGPFKPTTRTPPVGSVARHTLCSGLLLLILTGCTSRAAGGGDSPAVIVEAPAVVAATLSCEQVAMEETTIAAAAGGDDGLTAEQRSSLALRLSTLRSVAAAKRCPPG